MALTGMTLLASKIPTSQASWISANDTRSNISDSPGMTAHSLVYSLTYAIFIYSLV